MSAARQLRRQMTDAEVALWQALRARQAGARFRRQAPIGPYVVDFACFSRRLIVEVDGGQHSAAADAARTAWLESQGFTIVRFWNNDVLGNPEGVLAEIHAQIGQ